MPRAVKIEETEDGKTQEENEMYAKKKKEKANAALFHRWLPNPACLTLISKKYDMRSKN
jgi:hypothetical protein